MRWNIKLFVLLLLSCLTIALAQRRSVVEITSDLQGSYRQGESGSVTFNVRLNDPAGTVTHATAFLNMVQPDGRGGFAQRLHQVFGSASESPKLFAVAKPAAALIAGETTTLDFQIRQNARPGEYIVIVQVFPGTNTDPRRVRADERIGFGAFRIEILPR